MSRTMIQQRKKTRFNFIDALIVLLIIAVIAGAGYLLFTAIRQPRTATNGKVEFDVRIANVEASCLPLIKVGDKVKDSVTGELLGTIVSVQAEKSKYVGNVAVEQDDGSLTFAVTDYEDQYDVYVKISADAMADERGIATVGSTRIVIGSPVYFKVPSFKSISYITEFSTRNAG